MMHSFLCQANSGYQKDNNGWFFSELDALSSKLLQVFGKKGGAQGRKNKEYFEAHCAG